MYKWNDYLDVNSLIFSKRIRGGHDRMLMVDAKHIQKVYNTNGIQVNALKDTTLTIEKGEIVSIMGPSGCGKTTFPTVSLALTTSRVARSRLKERN